MSSSYSKVHPEPIEMLVDDDSIANEHDLKKQIKNECAEKAKMYDYKFFEEIKKKKQEKTQEINEKIKKLSLFVHTKILLMSQGVFDMNAVLCINFRSNSDPYAHRREDYVYNRNEIFLSKKGYYCFDEERMVSHHESFTDENDVLETINGLQKELIANDYIVEKQDEGTCCYICCCCNPVPGRLSISWNFEKTIEEKTTIIKESSGEKSVFMNAKVLYKKMKHRLDGEIETWRIINENNFIKNFPIDVNEMIKGDMEKKEKQENIKKTITIPVGKNDINAKYGSINMFCYDNSSKIYHGIKKRVRTNYPESYHEDSYLLTNMDRTFLSKNYATLDDCYFSRDYTFVREENDVSYFIFKKIILERNEKYAVSNHAEKKTSYENIGKISDTFIDQVISETIDLLESKGYSCEYVKSYFFGNKLIINL
jgi:hypothetical protein